jgi:hypothetical protein
MCGGGRCRFEQLKKQNTLADIGVAGCQGRVLRFCRGGQRRTTAGRSAATGAAHMHLVCASPPLPKQPAPVSEPSNLTLSHSASAGACRAG